MLIIILPAKIAAVFFMGDSTQNTKIIIYLQGDDDLENKTVPTTTNSTYKEDSISNTNIEKLKFEVGQEMGIKPKAKNKKN